MKAFLIVNHVGKPVILLGDRAMAERWVRESDTSGYQIVEMTLYTKPQDVFDL